MKSTGALTLLICASLMLSCGDGVPTLVPDSANTSVPAAGSNTTVPTQASDANTRTVTPVSDLSSTKLNPPHGQPGHRCDIAVGKPLNGTPSAQPATLTTPAAGVRTPPAALSQPSSTAPVLPSLSPALALNPAHGQPGHRCDIQVGQPLNSKPLSSNPVSLGSPVTATSPVNPAPILPAANATAVAPGMNPAHGQPGHRCDIPVGKPLNSK